MINLKYKIKQSSLILNNKSKCFFSDKTNSFKLTEKEDSHLENVFPKELSSLKNKIGFMGSKLSF